MRRTHWLLVEDNLADAELAREALAATTQVDLTIVGDGREALSYLRGDGVHARGARASLVLLDLNLPGLTGRDVLSEIRADPNMRHLPVIVMSSSEDEREIAALYRAGANCYLVKPMHHADFISMMTTTAQFWLSVVRLPPIDR